LGIFELDESYFGGGARRIRGKRGRGAAGKTPVFGLLKRHGKVFVTVRAELFKRGSDACNSRKDTGRFDNSYCLDGKRTID